MTKKKLITIISSIVTITAILVLAWRLYIFRYEDCMLFSWDAPCSVSCGFINIITHDYCK